MEIEVEIEEGFPSSITNDHNRLKQILINLISNAIKYTLEGSVYLKAGVIDSKTFFIDVKDTGVGIKEEHVTDLFKPFKKIMDNREYNKMGCGLGLTLSKNLA